MPRSQTHYLEWTVDGALPTERWNLELMQVQDLIWSSLASARVKNLDLQQVTCARENPPTINEVGFFTIDLESYTIDLETKFPSPVFNF